MYTNSTYIARYVDNVTELLRRIGYDAELGLLSIADDSMAWKVVLDLAVPDSGTSHRRLRFSFQANPCTSIGDECDIANLDCKVVGFLHVEKHVVLELVAAARAAMMEAVGEPEDDTITACGYADLARALTWAMVDAGEETVIARLIR